MKLPTLATVVALLELATAFKAPKRPQLSVYPLQPKNPLPASPPRHRCRYCIVPGGTEDAGPDIIKAARECNNGGTVVFAPDTEYTIGSPVDLTFLKHIDIAILGTIKPKPDVYYWVEKSFAYKYQDMHLFWRFGGEDVNIYGLNKGVIDGLGQVWWNAKKQNYTVIRPNLFGIDGLKGGSVSGLTMKNSPMWFNIIMDSENILVHDININVTVTNTSSPSSNTDGWDTYRSNNIVIQNSVIKNGDDCVSFKPNSTNILVQNLRCTGSHGISVGSLGQYQGQYDIAENIYVYNITMTNASNCGRVKIWPGVPPNTTGSSSGGGLGYVRNITWDTCINSNNELAIDVSQCYFAKSQELCNTYPASLVIEDVMFKNFYGTTRADHDPVVGTLVCSSRDVCKNIQARNINVTPPSGKEPYWICTNMDESLLDVNCGPPPPDWDG